MDATKLIEKNARVMAIVDEETKHIKHCMYLAGASTVFDDIQPSIAAAIAGAYISGFYHAMSEEQ